MKKSRVGDLIAVLFVSVIVVYLVIFSEHFTKLTSEYPYFMGFLKFALLAPFGRLLAGRLFKSHKWEFSWKLPYIAILWGLTGMWITAAFPHESSGTEGLISAGMWPDATGIQLAFFKSLWINFLGGYAFFMMMIHEVFERKLLCGLEDKPKSTQVVFIELANENWFVPILITVFVFWIPMHTITFMLPGVWRIIFAAGLSVALGLIKAVIAKQPAKD